MTKILLVEDDKSLREIYGVRLLAEGYDIISAGDGETALAMAIKDRPSLIVSDVMMPKISGFDMLDILRSTTETKNIKVIMMTALSSEDQRARGEALGADRYLVKSQVGIEDVVRTVHDVLGDAPMATASAAQTFTTSMSAPRPAAIIQPQPRPVPQPAPSFAPIAPTPVPQGQIPPQPMVQPGSLPQPTAPFSGGNRPANLGERILHPISQPADARADISSLIAQELSGTEQPTQNTMPVASNPLPPPQPAPTISYGPPQPSATMPQASQALHGAVSMPFAPAPNPPTGTVNEGPGISFEETPRPTSQPPAGTQPSV